MALRRRIAWRSEALRAAHKTNNDIHFASFVFYLNMPRKWIPVTFDEACKRAAGRRRYHAQRRRARDKRQLLIMGILVDLNWPGYGIGRVLAKSLSVDPATICRDLKYIRKWRAAFIKGPNMNEKFADAIIRRLVAARIHPKRGYQFTYTYTQGISSLTVAPVGAKRSGAGCLLQTKISA